MACFEQRFQLENIKKITWTVTTEGQPRVIKRCSKCGADANFINTGKFRVNANKKHLDIWLIYGCEDCKSTYNLSVYERIKPQDLPNALLEKYMRNDRELALEIGFDLGIHNRNQVKLDLEHVNYSIEGESPSAQDGVLIEITCNRPLEVRLDKILSQKLGISREQVKKLALKGEIISLTNAALLKEKLGRQPALILLNVAL